MTRVDSPWRILKKWNKVKIGVTGPKHTIFKFFKNLAKIIFLVFQSFYFVFYEILSSWIIFFLEICCIFSFRLKFFNKNKNVLKQKNMKKYLCLFFFKGIH